MKLRDRARLLVDQFWAGSVNAAARDLGIPQPTLQRFVTGRTPYPRVEVLAKLATYCDTSVEWLVSGAGDPPPETTATGVPITHNLLRWRRLVRSLRLEAHTQRIVEELPHGPANFTMMTAWSNKASRSRPSPPREASNLSAGAWVDAFEAAIKRFGVAAVRKQVEDTRVAAGCAYSGFGRYLSIRGGSKARSANGEASLAAYLSAVTQHDERLGRTQGQRLDDRIAGSRGGIRE